MNLRNHFLLAGERLRQTSAPVLPTDLKSPASAGDFVPACRRSWRRGTGVLFVCAVAGLLWSGAASARPSGGVQSPQAAQPRQVAVGSSAVDSVPQTTVVPVIQPAARIVERTTVYEDPTKGMDRTERRAYRAKVYAAKVDSLVQTRDYMFFPNSMQELPGGLIRSIYAEYFYFGMFIDHVEVHLPTERGVSQFVEILNFDSMSIRNYQAAQVQWGWSITFNIADGDEMYHADFAVSTATGETILTLITPRLTMRYVGWLWDKKINDPKFHRMNW